MSGRPGPGAAVADRHVVYRMGATRRVTHWINVLAVAVAVTTGMYIADPYYSSGITSVMSVNRTLHFYAAVVMDVTLIVNAYLFFLSRQDRPIDQLLPNAANWLRLQEAVLNVVTFNRRRRFDTSRMDPLNALLFTLLHLVTVFQLFTGFQLYVQASDAGTSSIGPLWPQIIHLTTDWTQPVFGGIGGVRLVHHAATYLVLVWVLLHIYYEVWRSVVWREADLAISIAGYKVARTLQPVERPSGEPEGSPIEPDRAGSAARST